MGKHFSRISLVILTVLVCCVEPYDIQSITSDNSLVVEGFISTELKQHHVRLSRTSQINKKEFIGETGATVVMKDQNGVTYPLTEEKSGDYVTTTLAGVKGNRYKLSFTLKNGKQYNSTEVELLDTPPITNLYAKFDASLAIGEGTGGIEIFLDTEDPSNKTQYYRWDFQEIYEIKTPYPSAFEWLGGSNVVFRTIPVDRCWGYDSSKNTIIRSVAGLAESKVSGQLLQTIPGYSPNLRIRYSILVRQYSLSKEAYLYWKGLKDINESQGSLYDRQPGTVQGNIRSASDNEIVLGYFDAGVVTSLRAFFTPATFNGTSYKVPKFLTSCDNFIAVEVPVSGIAAYYAKNGTSLVISEATGTGDPTLFLRPKYCCDCTNLGTNIKPSFWPQ